MGESIISSTATTEPDVLALMKQFVQCGFSVIPILPGEKRPGSYANGKWIGLSNWNRYTIHRPSEIEIAQWSNWPIRSIGLCTGKVSDVIALDFDNREDIHQKILEVIPDSPVKKRGAKGFTGFYRYNGEGNKKWTIAGETIVEILSDGRQTLIPPSIHPTGEEYEWLTNQTLLTCDIGNLPELNSAARKEISRIISECDQHPVAPATASHGIASSDFEETRIALTFIPADEYNLWIEIGMSLMSGFGHRGFELWDDWSKKSSKYNSVEMSVKWNSFTDVRDIHLGSLFFHARENGYESNSKEEIVVRKNAINTQSRKRFTPDRLVDQAPGLVGELVCWMNQTAIFRQPALALSAALAFVGALKAHRVQTESRLRTNIYTIGIAPSGSGKQRPIECVEALLNAADISLLGGEPESDAGLLDSLIEGNGARLLLWDEFGIVLGAITRSSSAHLVKLRSTMMRLFSSASLQFKGAEYSTRGGRDPVKRRDINQPCLCISATTTPGSFYESLMSEHARDGFIPRLLTFRPEKVDPKRQDGRNILPVPTELIRRIKEISSMPINVDSSGNLDELSCINPAVIKFSDEARKQFRDALEEFDLNKANSKSDERRAVWARAGEHVEKVALICEEGEQIKLSTLQWSIEVVRTSIECLLQEYEENVSDNEVEAKLKLVLRIVIKAGPRGITKSELTNATKKLTWRERDDIIVNLIEGGSISERDEKTKGRGAKLYTRIYREDD